MPNGLILPASGDYAATSTVTDETGGAIDGTGLVASIVDATGVLGSAVTASIITVNPLTVRIAVAWQGAWPVTAARLGTARLSLVSGAAENVSAPFAVDVSATALRLTHARGADGAWRFTWPDDRDGADLTGEALDVINASATLAPLASVVVIDAATRECELRIEGDLATALGDAGTLQLRRRIAGAQPRTLPPIAVTIR